jgi:GNAT superfamily N-acetyltransferase
MSEIVRDHFVISTDSARLQVDIIHKFLSEESYWANRRTLEQTQRAIENSICFGVYDVNKQIGFARVVTDRATFAYLGDVFILDEYRGLGLGKWLMETIISHPELQGLRRWVLATRDAHDLYSKYGFDQLRFPGRWMEKASPDAY